jgi:YbbR domain-containing protein
MAIKFSSMFLSLIVFVSCNNNNNTGNTAKPDDKPVIISNDTIPIIRSDINPKPVASFSKPVQNSLNDWHFAVNVYETKETFRYLVKLEYMELRETDTLKIPNIGIWPKVEIRPGKENYSCIIGFFDQGNNFKEYKQVTAKDDKLKVTVLHHYGVATYQSK